MQLDRKILDILNSLDEKTFLNAHIQLLASFAENSPKSPVLTRLVLLGMRCSLSNR